MMYVHTTKDKKIFAMVDNMIKELAKEDFNVYTKEDERTIRYYSKFDDSLLLIEKKSKCSLYYFEKLIDGLKYNYSFVKIFKRKTNKNKVK